MKKSETKKVNSRNLVGLSGVSTNKAGNAFARIRINGKQEFLGTFRTPELASVAHDVVANLQEKYDLKLKKQPKKGNK